MPSCLLMSSTDSHGSDLGQVWLLGTTLQKKTYKNASRDHPSRDISSLPLRHLFHLWPERKRNSVLITLAS